MEDNIVIRVVSVVTRNFLKNVIIASNTVKIINYKDSKEYIYNEW